jgi:hypothetical protein
MFHKIQSLVKYLKLILKDKDGKKPLEITADLAKLFAKHRNFGVLSFYVHRLMFKKTSGNVYDYIVAANKIIRKKYFPEENVKEDPIYNKIALNELLIHYNIPTPTCIGKIENKTFFSPQKTRAIKSKSHLRKIFDTILEDYPSVFVKKADSGNGSNVFKIEEDTKNLIDKIDPESDYIIEKTIIQHKALASINPNCLNTLKVITFRESHDIYFPNCYLRVGVGRSYLDNAKYGGFFIKYDIDRNRLDEVGYTYVNYGGKTFYKHPDTNYVFKDKRLIYSEEIKRILKKAALLFGGPLIGWDIAFSTEGPAIIEASLNPNLKKSQITSKGLLSNPIYRKIFGKG